MKKYGLELMLGCLLLVSFLILSKQAAEVSETMSSTENSKTILVDAGHGGADPGMIGVNGLEEKGINLQIAVKLKDSLEKQGFSVIMTREEDKGLYEEDSRNQKAQDMQRRIALVKECNKTYYLLKRSESVLNIVECGFLTNPEEAGLLCKEEYQNKIVEAIVKGIEQYLKQQKI